tara:strand:- start:59 stop:658 length:600 start_codon:yes stop_codon:yes gene_type:complete
MINSGIYAFFFNDFDTGKLILTVGKCEDKEKRLASYRVTNAGINFHYFKKVPINQLRKEEKSLIKYFKKCGYKLFKNSQEQFLVDNESITRELLSERMSLSINKDYKNIDYNVSTLDGENFDIRNTRPSCDFIPGEDAMTVTAAGLGEKYRKVMTRYVPNGKEIIKLDNPEKKVISEKGWDVWQAATKNALHKQRKGPF